MFIEDNGNVHELLRREAEGQVYYEMLEKEKPEKKVTEEDEYQDAYSELIVAVDTEFTQEEPLTIQAEVIFKEQKFVFVVVNSKYKQYIQPYEKYPEFSKVSFFYSDFDDFESPLLFGIFSVLDKNNLLQFLPDKAFCVKLFFYYSLKDLTYSFGLSMMRPYYLNQKRLLLQRRNVTGVLKMDYTYKTKQYRPVFVLKDLSGLFPGGLKDLAASVGLKKEDSLDLYKKDMTVPLKEKTVEFLRYGINDAVLLPTIYELKTQSFNNILDIYSLPKHYYFQTKNFPTTVGTTVSILWLKYIDYALFKSNKFIKLAMYKQGILNKMHPNYNQNLMCFKQLQQISSLSQLEQFSKKDEVFFDLIYNSLSKPKVFLYKATQYGSIDFLISEAQNMEAATLGFTTGGRTVNERPAEYTIECGADIDIGGAYGSKLQNVFYPVGRPRIVSFSSNEKSMTLGKFMQLNKHNFTLGLYKISVSGTLSFNQDLIFSKLTPNKKVDDLRINYDKLTPDTAAIDVPFVLLRKQIVNGFITQPIWELIEKVATNKEKNEIYNLSVNSAIYWSDKDKVDTIEELADIFLSDKGQSKYQTEHNAILDNRSFKWYAFSIGSFIKPLLSKRKELKKSKDSISKALEQSIKLVVNTTWGLLTSPYFEISNVVCSEIVTAGIRVSVWQMSKALNTYLSITDGGPYSLTKVSFIKSKEALPGLATLSSYYVYSKHRTFQLGNLGGVDWVNAFKNNVSPGESPFVNLDSLAQKHIEEFWLNYGIKIDFVVEHKMQNLFVKGSYLLKAHYAFMTYNSETKQYDLPFYKIRGFRLEEGFEPSPIYKLLTHLLKPNYSDIFDYGDGKYYQKKLLKLNAWRSSLKGQKTTYGPDVYPGDSVFIESEFRLNNTFVNIGTAFMYKRIQNRTRSAEGNGLFEKFLKSEGIKSTFERMIKHNMRTKKYKKRTNTTKPRKKKKED